MASFGELLGADIREEREQRGWTQLALAVRALGDANGERRVRDYETGKVKHPRAKVYQPICDALGITRQRIGELKAQATDAKTVTDDEIDALRIEKGSLEQALSDVQTLSRAQLEALASRFEMDEPYKRSDGALIEFLTKKAEDYRSLKAEVDAIEDGLKRLSNLKSAAQDAIASGDFEEVEEILSRVMEVELEEAAKTAELRAENALLRGRHGQAAALLHAGAESFSAIDPKSHQERLHKGAKLLYANAVRYGPSALPYAIEMWRNLAGKVDKKVNRLGWAVCHFNIATALSDWGQHAVDSDRDEIYRDAISACRIALEVFQRDEYPTDWAATQNNLGNALYDQGSRMPGEKGKALLSQAVGAYRAALEVFTPTDQPLSWPMTKSNLANALCDLGSRIPGKPGNRLLDEAEVECREALRVRGADPSEIDWAIKQNNLAKILIEKGCREEESSSTGKLVEAIMICENVLDVVDAGKQPMQWAMTCDTRARAEFALSEQGTCSNSLELLAAAMADISAALEIYDPQKMPYDHRVAAERKALIAAKMAAGDDV